MKSKLLEFIFKAINASEVHTSTQNGWSFVGMPAIFVAVAFCYVIFVLCTSIL